MPFINVTQHKTWFYDDVVSNVAWACLLVCVCTFSSLRSQSPNSAYEFDWSTVSSLMPSGCSQCQPGRAADSTHDHTRARRTRFMSSVCDRQRVCSNVYPHDPSTERIWWARIKRVTIGTIVCGCIGCKLFVCNACWNVVIIAIIFIVNTNQNSNNNSQPIIKPHYRRLHSAALKYHLINTGPDW